ncbi:hypothetical protein [Litoribacter populi]|uniref:hypothetical protein n=1 Tax=Litoribacter populi TaxID=2598460 RepID=UPI00117CC754|nr:hypothetical protein [Litoribacter populi]
MRYTKKNKFRFLIMAFGLFMVSSTAFPCGGTYYACGEDDVLDMGMDALLNCCEGSTMSFYDVCSEQAYLLVVPEDGENSSCAP